MSFMMFFPLLIRKDPSLSYESNSPFPKHLHNKIINANGNSSVTLLDLHLLYFTGPSGDYHFHDPLADFHSSRKGRLAGSLMASLSI